MKKNKLLKLAILALLAIHAVPAAAGTLNLNLTFKENMFFSKYDVDVILDDDYIDTISHGKQYKKRIKRIDDGQHTIRIQQKDNEEVFGEAEFTSSGDTTYEGLISTYEGRVEIRDANKAEETVEQVLIPVPDLQGFILADAKDELEKAGFAVIEAESEGEPVTDEDNWVVVSQNAEAGTEADQNEPVILECEETQKYLEDRIVGLDVEQTKQKADELKFDVRFMNEILQEEIEYGSGEMPEEEKENWKAVSVVPDSSGKRSAEVGMLYYGQRKVPDVIDSSLEKALSVLAENNFSKVRSISLESEGVKIAGDWAVIYQSPEPGSDVSADTIIKLFVRSYESLIKKEEKEETEKADDKLSGGADQNKSGTAAASDITATPVPEVSGAPEVTATPEVTVTPGVTGAPEVSATPGVSAAPEVSVTPGVSAAPEVSVTPGVSAAPEVSVTPGATAAPEVTVTPGVSGAPEVTVTPGVSAAPEVTVTPGVTGTPEGTAVPEVSVTPGVSGAPEVTVTPRVTAAPDAATPEVSATPEAAITPEAAATLTPGAAGMSEAAAAPEAAVTPETTVTPGITAAPEPTITPEAAAPAISFTIGAKAEPSPAVAPPAPTAAPAAEQTSESSPASTSQDTAGSVPESTVTPASADTDSPSKNDPSNESSSPAQKQAVVISEEMTAEKCSGERVGIIKKRFIEAGFKKPKFKRVKTKNKKNEKIVFDITINGSNAFSAGDQFDADASVVISYWITEEADKTAEAEKASSGTLTPAPDEKQAVVISKKMSAEKCIGKSIGVVKRRYVDAGFTDLHFKQEETDEEQKQKVVFEITINGSNTFSAGDQFDPDASVEISYWVYSPASAESTETGTTDSQ